MIIGWLISPFLWRGFMPKHLQKSKDRCFAASGLDICVDMDSESPSESGESDGREISITTIGASKCHHFFSEESRFESVKCARTLKASSRGAFSESSEIT